MKIVKQLASALLCFSMLLPLAACGKKSPAATADFTLTDIIDSLPKYTTTGVSEPRAGF